MVRMMVVGDTHGGIRHLEYKAKHAKALGADRMMVVGDFGMWPGWDGIKFLDDVNSLAREYDLHVFALPGNHEDHDQWDKWLNMGLPTSSGFTYVRDRLLISPKVHNWKWGDKRFFICGGAVSIDKGWRTEGKSWWKNETFSEENLASVEKYKGPAIDYLFTHDCSDYTVWRNRLKPDPDSQRNRNRIDRAIAALRPRMHFHGHMHDKYDWINTRSHGRFETAWGVDEADWNGASTHTYGLECNSDDNSWVILDTGQNHKVGDEVVVQEDAVYWPGKAFAMLSKED